MGKKGNSARAERIRGRGNKSFAKVEKRNDSSGVPTSS